MRKRIAVLKGDGIGPEIVDEAIKALDTAADRFGFSVQYDYKLLGGAAMMPWECRCPRRQVDSCRSTASQLGST